MSSEKILVIGAGGQIGSVLIHQLANIYGLENVVASDLRPVANWDGPSVQLDMMDRRAIESVSEQYSITQIYHLAAILSANGEKNPLGTWDLNMTGLFNVLETAREKNMNKVFFPSSIAVFGADAPSISTPQATALNPTTVYGISKVAGELWGQYYFQRYGLDVRSVRYPGIIGHQSNPGGGTTDYAVDIFHKAAMGEPFTCFLQADTVLPMIYMDDAIRGTIELMRAPANRIKLRSGYNLSGMSFSPREIVAAIRAHIPDFQITYAPDFRQKIADSWPDSIDDTPAKRDWGWQPNFNLKDMTADMLFHLEQRVNV